MAGFVLMDMKRVFLNPNYRITKKQDSFECINNQGNLQVVKGKEYQCLINLFDTKTEWELSDLLSKLMGIFSNKEGARFFLFKNIRAGLLILEPDKHDFNETEIQRYKRQLKFWNQYQNEKDDSYDIQNNLKRKQVSVIGLGGQGSVVAAYLGMVGVGSLKLIDGDSVDISNLSRQIFYTHENIGKNKAVVLSEYIKRQNPFISVESIPKFIEKPEDATAFLRDSDFIVLCGDNPMVKLREWINIYAVKNKIPYIGVSGSWVGPMYVPGLSACYECEKDYYRKKYPMYDELIDWIINRTESSHRPAFAFRPSLSGLLIAQQAVKYLSGVMNVEVTKGRWRMDLEMNTGFEEIPRNHKCKICGKNK